jgi:hypothetical protein
MRFLETPAPQLRWVGKGKGGKDLNGLIRRLWAWPTRILLSAHLIIIENALLPGAIRVKSPRPKIHPQPAWDPSLSHVGTSLFLLINFLSILSSSIVSEVHSLHSQDKELGVNQELSATELTEL